MLSARVANVFEQVSHAPSRFPFLLILAFTLGMNPCDIVSTVRGLGLDIVIVGLAADRIEVYERRAFVVRIDEPRDVKTLAVTCGQLPDSAAVNFAGVVRVRVPSLVLDRARREFTREADKPQPGVHGILTPSFGRLSAACIG